MNIKDSYIHNGTAVLKDVKVENSVLKKILAGKDANDAYLGWETVCDLTGIKPKAAGTADKVGHKLTFNGGVTGAWDGSADKTVTIPTKSSWNYDDVYLKLTGNGTTNPLTGTIYIKDVNGIIINSKDKDLNIWEVYGNSGVWASQYGFNLQYTGTGSGNNNDLVLWAHNKAGTHIETYRVKQDGTFIFKAAPKVGTNIMYHAGNLTIKTLMGTTAIGDSDEPVYWNGSSFVKAGAYPTKASWNYDDRYLKLAGGTMSNTNIVNNLNADLLDGYHASSFYQNKTLHSDQDSIYDLRFNYGQYDKGDFNGTYKDEYPTNYGSYIALTARDKNIGALMFFDAPINNKLGHIYVRTRGTGDSNTTYSEWGTIAYLTDNVASSSKWINARTITLIGSVTGSVSIDGSSNVTLSTTTNHTHTKSQITDFPTSLPANGGNADRAKFLETFHQNSTINTYGSQYPIWAQWSDSANVRLKCTNYTVWTDKADNAVNADKLDNYHAGVTNGSVGIFVPWPNNTTLKNEGLMPSEYGTSEFGHPDNVYLQSICKWAIAHYTSLGSVTLIGAIAPNSSGTCILNLYSSSGKDSSTLLPRYCSGTYTALSGYIYNFGTVEYNWYYRQISAGYASSAGSVAWANITGKPSSFTPSSHSHPYLPTEQVRQEQNTDAYTWIRNYALDKLRGHVYNTHNLEWQYLFGISSGKTYGSILRTSYGNGTPRIQVMGLTNGTWSSWREVAYDDNTVKKDGTGASGTWGINITGSAGRLSLTSCYNGTTNNDLWSTIKSSNSSYLGTATIYEVYNDGGPDTYGEVLDIISVHNNHWQPQLWFGPGKSGRLRYRNKEYNDNSWGDWRTVAWTSDIPSVGNGTVTVTQAGSTIGSFTMNQSGNTLIALNDTNTNYYPIRSYTSGLQISSYSGSTDCALFVPYATSTIAGAISTAAQSFAGQKTFLNGIKVGSTRDDQSTDNTKIYFGDSNYVWIGESPQDDALMLNCGSSKNIYFSFAGGTAINSSNYTTYAKIYMSNSGAVYASSGFYESSDERLKRILNPVKVNLDDLSKLRKIYYLWNNTPEDGRQLGMIAQDVQKLYPELVSMDKNTGYLSLAYDKLSVIALEAIDTLYEEYKQLKEHVNKLEKLLHSKEIL